MTRGVAISLSPHSGRFGRLGRLGLRLAAQPIAVALEIVDLAVVEQAVDEGRGQRRVVQDAPPLREALVRLSSYEESGSPPTSVVAATTTPHHDGGEMENDRRARPDFTAIDIATRWPALGQCEAASTWLRIQADLGLAARTIEAYARGLADYLKVCAREGIEPLRARGRSSWGRARRCFPAGTPSS